MALQGMDVEQVRQASQWLFRHAEEVEDQTQHASTVINQLLASGWEGPDAQHFRDRFSSEALTSLHRSIEALRQLAQVLRMEADQQEQASDIRLMW